MFPIVKESSCLLEQLLVSVYLLDAMPIRGIQTWRSLEIRWKSRLINLSIFFCTFEVQLESSLNHLCLNFLSILIKEKFISSLSHPWHSYFTTSVTVGDLLTAYTMCINLLRSYQAEPINQKATLFLLLAFFSIIIHFEPVILQECAPDIETLLSL